MGVATARNIRTRAGLTHRAYDRPSRLLRAGRKAGASERLVPAAPWWPDVERKTFWSRMKDDRELTSLKVLLLTSLLLLAAMLEWVA